MKQFKLLILLLVIGFVGEAQINYLPIKSRYKLIAGLFDSTLHIPSGTTPWLRTGGYDYRGAVFYRTSDSTVYVYTGTQWISVKGSGGGGSADSTVFATLYRVDTAKVAIRLSIAGKLNISDTAALVAGYTRLQRFTDSLAAHTTRFNGVTSSLATKLNISDTANMRPRLYAGSNVTITGTYPNLTIASSGGGSSDTSTFIVDTTYNRLAYAISADSLWLKSIRIQQGGVDVTPTVTDSTVSWNLTAGGSVDTTSLSNRINLKLNISDTASMLTNYVRRQELKDTAAAIRAAMGGGSGTVTSVATNTATGITGGTITTTGTLAIDTSLISTRRWRQKGIDSVQANLALKVNISDTASMLTNYPTFSSFTSGRLALVNGSKTLYSSSKFNFSDATYPTMSIIGSDPLIYIGPSATLLNNPAFGHAAGAAIYGGATYKGVQLVDQISGGIQMARFYNSAGTIYNNLNGLVISNTLSSPSNYQGNFAVQRTVPYANNLNYHGFTDQTIFNAQSTAFNSFGSFVTFGNDRFTQDHYAAFQSVWYKDSSNQMTKVYDFAAAVSEHREGHIDSLFRFKVWPVTITGGATMDVEYGLYLPGGSATTKYGAYIEDNVGIGTNAPSEKLHVNGNIKTADPGSGSGSWKLGVAVTTSGLTLNTTTYVEISIGGTVYRLAVVDPPQP